MVDIKSEVSAIKGWATIHVLAFGGICAAVGFALGALLF